MLRLVQILPIFFLLIFAVVIGLFFYILFQAAARQKKNRAAPELVTAAAVVAKREQYRGSLNHDSHRVFTRYYATFQVSSGDRMELEVPSEEYGLLAEGDVGRLTFRGDQFLRFEREL